MSRLGRGTLARTLLLALPLLAAACDAEAELPEGVHTVVLITVDDLRADRLAQYGNAGQAAPTIARLAAEGTVHPDPIATSTSRNAALASILTGKTPPEHALSMGVVGRQRLAQRFETLAELFGAAGFRTLAAVSTRQATPRLSGFDQGFERYLADDLPETGGALAPAALMGRLLPELQRLPRNERVFLWLHFGHLREDPTDLGAAEEGLLRTRLLPFAQSDPELKRELESLDITRALVPRVEAVIGRKRGSPAWNALREALYAVQLERLDSALALLVAELERSGRYDDSVIALVGTRGRYLTEDRPDGRVEGFSRGIVRVPLIVRAPEPGPVLAGPRSTTETFALLRAVLQPGAEPPTASPVRVYSGEWAVAEVQAEFKLVGKDGADAIWIRRLDDAVVGMPAPFEKVAGGPLPDSSAEVLRVSADAMPAPPGVPLLPDRAAEEWEVPTGDAAPGWIVDVALDGTWWQVTVADPERAGEPVHVFAAAEPMDADASPLETRLGTAERLSDPALPDAVVVSGTLPLEFGIRARARSRLGLFVSVAKEAVPHERMRYLGRHFAGTSLTFLVPPWMPERPDWFSNLAAESEPSPAWAREPWATISAKRGSGVYLMEGPIDLTTEEIRFLTRMDKSE